MNSSNRFFADDKDYYLLRDKLVMYFSGRGCSDPENLADETIVRLVNKYPAEGPLSGVNLFAFGIAKNIRYEWLRDHDRQAVSLQDQQLGTESPETAWAERILSNTVTAGLSSEERDLLHERFVEGQDFNTIASRRGITSGGVRARVHRVLKALAQDYAAVMQQSCPDGAR